MDMVYIEIGNEPGPGKETIGSWRGKHEANWKAIISRLLELCRLPDVLKEGNMWYPLSRLSDLHDIMARLHYIGALTVVSTNGKVEVKLEPLSGHGVSVTVDYSDDEDVSPSEMLARAIVQTALTYTQIEDGVFNNL